MARLHFVLSVAVVIASVSGKPVEDSKVIGQNAHHLWKRFINTALATGNFDDYVLSKLRTKRGTDEECEKLQLCKLHARSSSNFLAAYELYFVNKENAKLWDHRTHSIADCEQRFSGCYGGAVNVKTNAKSYTSDDYDYNY